MLNNLAVREHLQNSITKLTYFKYFNFIYKQAIPILLHFIDFKTHDLL